MVEVSKGRRDAIRRATGQEVAEPVHEEPAVKEEAVPTKRLEWQGYEWQYDSSMEMGRYTVTVSRETKPSWVYRNSDNTYDVSYSGESKTLIGPGNVAKTITNCMTPLVTNTTATTYQ